MTKANILVISGFMRINFDNEIDKVNDIIELVNNKYNTSSETYKDMIYLEMYPTEYQGKMVTGVDIKIVKPTKKLINENFKNLKKDLFKIFHKRLTILVMADKEKIF